MVVHSLRADGDAAAERADAERVSRMARGDRVAMMALYDAHSPSMLAVGARILGDRREAEDLLHDVFIEIWQTAAQYDPQRGKVSTWLMLRMRSRGVDRVRSTTRSRTVVTDEPLAHEPVSTRDPALAADRIALGHALGGLPPEQRKVLELAYFLGMSSSEVAAEVGVSIGTVKSRIAAAIQKLRLALGERGES